SRRRHTRSKRDWSSDVCSSDLIRPGDMITPLIKTRRLNDTPFLLGKAWDNRIGVAVAVEVLKHAKEKGHQTVLYSGANVQEEVGLRGAKVAANLVQPDIAIALDTGTAGDTPGMTKAEADSELGRSEEHTSELQSRFDLV